jgi:vitamin B12 transporter
MSKRTFRLFFISPRLIVFNHLKATNAMRNKIVLTLLGSVITLQLLAQDSLKTHLLEEAVVTGTKFEVPQEKSGKVIFKINADRLQTAQNLSSVLNQIPGVQMDGIYGTPGTNVSYFIRGGRSRHSLILLDGVPMNDPTGIDPFFDLRFLSTDQIDNVEVLQGGLSTLYGSGAAASVINIQSKQGIDGIHGSFGLQAGSWKTFSQNLNVNGTQGKFSFLVTASNLKSGGFSAAQDNDDAVDFDDDGFERRNGFVKVGYQISTNLKVDVFGGIDWFDAEYDNGAFADGDNTLTQRQNRLGAKATWNYDKGYVQWVLQHTDVNRDVKSSYPSEYDGDNLFSELIHKHELNSWLTVLSGISFQELNYDEKNAISKDTTSFTIVDPYTSLLFSLPNGLNVHAGIRLNNHSDYGSNLIYNFNPSWLIQLSDQIRIKPFASVSSSYITPSLFQLHTPWGGNIDLDPERSLNSEYGLSFFLSDQLTFTAVNFIRKEEDVIGYTFQYENVSKKREVKGVTVDASFKPSDIVSFTGDFSWVTSDDKSSFYRIPARKAGFSMQFKPLKETSVSLRYQFTSTRVDLYYDETFTPHDIELDDYDLLDLTVSQSLLKNHLFLYGSVYNLTDENFVGVYGFTTQGRNFSLGVKYSF